jgi:hypothetical protein
MVSNRFSLFGSFVLIEINERIQEKVKSIAITEVISSMIVLAASLVIRSEVITKRQNPRRFADVFRICWEVLFAIF